MSTPAQAGTPDTPSPAPRGALATTRHNPVWIRELVQAARLQRTPVVLAVITGLATLLMGSVGGLASVSAEPARVGVALHHTFFTIAFALVTWVGPAVAASTIAAERSGRTWEALLLTGLTPTAVARGKFLAALTYIGLYLVMLAPVGSLSFLFGGVTALEVLLSFVFLGLFAVLGVAFGLAISSRMASAAAAVVVVLFVAVTLSLFAYFGLGVGMSFAIHDLWPGVPEGFPVWLPTAYVRGEFGLEYLGLLVVAPLALTLVPAWFLYEVTVGGVLGPSDDRSTGIRRWFLVCAPLLAAAGAAVSLAMGRHALPAAAVSLVIYWHFLLFATFVFAGEPLGPSRKVLVHWQERGVSAWQQRLGPGVVKATGSLIALGLAGMLTIAAAGAFGELVLGRGRGDDVGQLFLLTAYPTAFIVFLAGLAAWMRTRSQGATGPRLGLLAALFLAMAGPWVVLAITGMLDLDDGGMLLAAASPIYVFEMADQYDGTSIHREAVLGAGGACVIGWFLLGLALQSAAGLRASRRRREEARRFAEIDALFAAEEAQQHAALASAGATPEDPTAGTGASVPADAPAPPGPDDAAGGGRAP